MKKFLSLLITLILSVGAYAQNDEVVKQINKEGWKPQNQCLTNKKAAESYIPRIMQFTKDGAAWVQKNLEKDHEQAIKILQVRDEIIGKTKKVKKQDKQLSKYFDDVSKARQTFAQADTTLLCYQMLSGFLESQQSPTVKHKMPAGALTYFKHRISNGFAGTLNETTLTKKDGKGLLTVNIQNMRFNPEEKEKEPVSVEVDDSVFQRVRSMVESGLLYDVNTSYVPETDIMDASNWSMDFKFEKGNISSSGYAVGPDHSDSLHKILRYLITLYNELKGEEEENQ